MLQAEHYIYDIFFTVQYTLLFLLTPHNYCTRITTKPTHEYQAPTIPAAYAEFFTPGLSFEPEDHWAMKNKTLVG